MLYIGAWIKTRWNSLPQISNSQRIMESNDNHCNTSRMNDIPVMVIQSDVTMVQFAKTIMMTSNQT